MFSDSRRGGPEFLETLVIPSVRCVATVLVACCFLLIIYGSARSLTGGEDVSLNDIGAKASVALYYEGEHLCGGVVFKDRYILTAAHCFTDGKGTIDIEPEEIEVFYWSSGKARRDIRKVEEIAIKDNYLNQEIETERLGENAWDLENFPVNHEDIAVLKIIGTHPVGSVSAFVSDIDNEYTADGGDAPTGPATWFYIYGSAVNGSIGKLQRALIGQYGPLQRVIPGKAPGIFYRTRQMTTIPSGFDKEVSQCKGDSGSGVFLVKSDGLEYSDQPEKLPDGGIQLKQGHPIVVGLVSGHPITDISQKDARCGRDVGAIGFMASRVDYHHDWIFSKIEEMQ
jgi:hypothetical protein